MDSWFLAVAMLVTVTALFAWINVSFFKLPQTIGLLIMGFCASFVLIAGELLFPGAMPYRQLLQTVASFDFSQTLMTGMLGFLLFAGALHVDLGELKSRGWAVGVMATFGTMLSTAVVGVAFWLASRALGVTVPLVWAFVFGALISPTDPVAVMATLKTARVSRQLKTDMGGESLFNDGVGVVLFTILAATAAMGGLKTISPTAVVEMFLVEAAGGALLGLLTGYVAYRAMRHIDDYVVEVLISLALVMGTYALAGVLGLSGPIAVVVAGLLIGNTGVAHAMSEKTRDYLFAFWTLVDEMLNFILFLFIGLEVIVLSFNLNLLPLALSAIPIAIVARLLSVSASVGGLRWFTHFPRGTIALLTWGGLRGGISIAMALSLPDMPYRTALIAATYCVALFTIVVQGLTFPALIKKFAA
ncbi:MAG: sodium:proton antiporter [Alphaproteobacteria bacterium]|nr:sodium:proton antiporter [Alphaproteobacteria bacterium]MDE1986594.1 sodium:proton antiporter [Alphaproteobacteria bacterium]MDE2164303.1 sodium:proton antiporter [Alphaproteobacteria bacterium]MDE2266211.1 sodium:proton antiporter [Alphaproteobacteria bacterium]